jgi:hypothetical protein
MLEFSMCFVTVFLYRTLPLNRTYSFYFEKYFVRSERRAEDEVCVQICILYYILLYEDVRLATMRSILASGRQVSRTQINYLCTYDLYGLVSNVLFLMRADTLRGEVRGVGLALEIESFMGPCEMARAGRRVLFGAQKAPPPTPPSPPPHPELITNQQLSVRCIKGRSGS